MFQKRTTSANFGVPLNGKISLNSPTDTAYITYNGSEIYFGGGGARIHPVTAQGVFGNVTCSPLTIVGNTTWSVTHTDSSGTPGNASYNTASGTSAIAAAASACVITNTTVTAISQVYVQMLSADATVVRLIPTTTAGVLTITGFNAAAVATAATATLRFRWFLINQ